MTQVEVVEKWTAESVVRRCHVRHHGSRRFEPQLDIWI
ncbi:hypothetical protein L837_3631 [Mycobacterium avium MAV_061107_1842]|nr:hypothetical protein L837_3631 [Mycobacterium avium MAV_061107_1842]